MKKSTLLKLTTLLGVALWMAAPAGVTAQDSPEEESPSDTAPADDPSSAAPEEGAPEEGAAASPGGDASPEGEIVPPDGEAPGAAEIAPEVTAAQPTDASPAPDGATDEIDDGHDEVPPPEGVSEEAPPETPASTALSAPEAEAPAADEEPAAEAPAAPAASAPAPLPWRNTFFTWNNQASFNSFLRDAQLSYNPTYSQNFTLTPRWYVAPTSFFWFTQSLGFEVTDSDGAALNRDPQVTDTLIDFRHMFAWEGFIIFAAARIGIPISKISQAAQRYLQTGLTATLVRPIPDLGLTLAGLFSYRRWWAGSNVVQVGEPQPDSCPAPQAPISVDGDSAPVLNTATCDQLGTPSSARDVLLYGLSATFAPPGFSDLNVSLQVFFFTTYGHELAPAYVDVDTRDEPIRIDDGSPSHWNNFSYIALSVGYQILPWWNLSIGIQNSGLVSSVYNPDGSIRNPIFTPDTQVFLSATFQVDEIFTQLTGGGEEDLTPEERLRRRQGLASGPTSGGTF